MSLIIAHLKNNNDRTRKECCDGGFVQAGACNVLSDFLNEVQAQTGTKRGKKLSEVQAQRLTGAAEDVRVQIGC